MSRDMLLRLLVPLVGLVIVGIPFYRLPEVLKAIPELQKPKVTTLNPLDIIRCLRLKVWCVETQRMVGVRGL